MTDPDIFIGRVEPDGVVVGTNNADDLSVGTLFTQLVKTHVEDQSGAATAIDFSYVPISLRLVEAYIYRRSVAVVPRGWSAGLRFEGVGLDAITNALTSKVAAELIHLRATVDAA